MSWDVRLLYHNLLPVSTVRRVMRIVTGHPIASAKALKFARGYLLAVSGWELMLGPL